MSDEFILIAHRRLRTPTETAAIAARLATILGAGDLVALTGDLGVGKSHFARNFVRTKMADHRLDVPSPTFTLVQTYAHDNCHVAHADLYRLDDPEEVDELGLEDLLEIGAVLVEWPDRLPPDLQQRALLIRLSIAADGSRLAEFFGAPNWADRLDSFFAKSPAMLLAAGRGTRMGALSDVTPKPLVPVLGRTLLDRALDRLRDADQLPATVNVHHLADVMLAHLQPLIETGDVLLSDEQDALLETGGGVVRAADRLADIFTVINSDALWLDGQDGSALRRLRQAFDPSLMDVLLLLVPMAHAQGGEGAGDYDVTDDQLNRPHQITARRGDRAAYLYGGIMVTHQAAYRSAPDGAFSNKQIFDAAEQSGRLFGLVHDGRWMHVGTPEGLKSAEQTLREIDA